MKKINSSNNIIIKNVKKLHYKKYRKLTNKFIVEGWHFYNYFLKKPNQLLKVITNDANASKIKFPNKIVVPELLMSKLSTTSSEAPVICVCKITFNQIDWTKDILILDNLQDPGNIGTLIRTAKGFGFVNVIICQNNVDLYNPKLIRATQTYLFECNVLVWQKPIQELITQIIQAKYVMISTYLEDLGKKNKVFNSKLVSKNSKLCLFLGNEGEGLDPIYSKYPLYNLKINTSDIESLNVSIAGGILMHTLKLLKNQNKV